MLGYLVLALSLFLPGLATVALFRLSDGLSLVDILALAFGISMGVNATVVELYFGGSTLLGLHPHLTTVLPIAILLVSCLLLGFSILQNRSSLLNIRAPMADIVTFLTIAFLGVFLLLYFEKYPYFPAYDSTDFFVHAQYLANTVSFENLTPLTSLLYYGVHFNLAFAYLFEGAASFVVARDGMAIFVLFSPLLVFSATNAIFDSRRAAAISAVLYALGGPIWFNSVFNAGLYPNFYGILASLFLLVAIRRFVTSRGRAVWLLLGIAVCNAYLSHYSTLVLAAPLILIPIVFYFRDRQLFRRAALGSACFVVPGVVGLLVFPSYASFVLGVSYALGPGSLVGETYLSGLLSSVPQLQDLVLIVGQDVAAVLLLILGVLGSFYALRKSSFSWIPVIWVITLLAATPTSAIAWRYSFLTLVPLTLLASYAISQVSLRFERDQGVKVSKLRRKTPFRRGRWPSLAVAAVILLPIVVGSWGTTQLADVATQSSQSHVVQQQVYDSLAWMASNVSPGSQVISVSDWTLEYSQLLGGPIVAYGPLMDPAKIQNSTFSYVITTNVTTLASPPSRNSYDIYRSLPGARLVYSNPDVQILNISGS